MSAKRKSLLLVMVDRDPSINELEFNQWYYEEHVPERLACPGFLSARRFHALQGSPEYLAIYELEGPEALQTPEYLRYAHSPLIGDNVDEPVGSERTKRMLAGFRSVVRNIYVELDADDFPLSGNADPQLAT